MRLANCITLLRLFSALSASHAKFCLILRLAECHMVNRQPPPRSHFILPIYFKSLQNFIKLRTDADRFHYKIISLTFSFLGTRWADILSDRAYLGLLAFLYHFLRTMSKKPPPRSHLDFSDIDWLRGDFAHAEYEITSVLHWCDVYRKRLSIDWFSFGTPNFPRGLIITSIVTNFVPFSRAWVLSTIAEDAFSRRYFDKDRINIYQIVCTLEAIDADFGWGWWALRPFFWHFHWRCHCHGSPISLYILLLILNAAIT